MISTQNYSTLPHRLKLKEICKSISVIDAILSEDWLDRYYTFNSKWTENEEFGAMNNAQGDELLILFRKDGCVINGMTHEYYPKNKVKLTMDLPGIYHDFIFGEPVHSTGTTFCIWTNDQDVWQTAVLDDYNDGSGEMLEIFDGNPQTYIDWATDYYEDGFIMNENTFKVVSDIYNGKVLTTSMVLVINNNIEHWDQLREDLLEINYPSDF